VDTHQFLAHGISLAAAELPHKNNHFSMALNSGLKKGKLTDTHHLILAEPFRFLSYQQTPLLMVIYHYMTQRQAS